MLGVFFEKVNQTCYSEIESLVENFMEKRNSDKTGKWEKCFAKLLVSLGEDYIYKFFKIDLNFDSKDKNFENTSNLWILRVFLNTLKNRGFSFFFKYLFPLIQELENLHKTNKTIDLVNKTVHEFIISQLW